MIPSSCPGCGSPAPVHLAVSYLYPRGEIAFGAVDPCHVFGSAPLRTCGAVACQVVALLAAVDQVVAAAWRLSRNLISPGDVRIVSIGDPGEFRWLTCQGEAA